MTERLDDGSLDLAFALETEPPETLERLELSAEELAVAVSLDHPLAADRGPVGLAELGDQALIAFQPGSSTRAVLDGAFARAGVQPRIALEANDFALVRALVARGVGIAILPRSFLVRPGPPIAFRPLSPPVQMRVVLWWRRGGRGWPAPPPGVEVNPTPPPPNADRLSAAVSAGANAGRAVVAARPESVPGRARVSRVHPGPATTLGRQRLGILVVPDLDDLELARPRRLRP
jgi:hypothetical protein